MPNLVELAEITPIQVWESVVARRVQGESLTLAVVELAPDSIVPEHRHPNEQCGLVIRGQVRFRIGDEVRTFGPGGTWRILSNEPHEVHTGPEGATVVDVFSPIRADWEGLPVAGTAEEPAPVVWPGR
jgi:unsaturated pyranuronate lyase